MKVNAKNYIISVVKANKFHIVENCIDPVFICLSIEIRSMVQKQMP